MAFGASACVTAGEAIAIGTRVVKLVTSAAIKVARPRAAATGAVMLLIVVFLAFEQSPANALIAQKFNRFEQKSKYF